MTKKEEVEKEVKVLQEAVKTAILPLLREVVWLQRSLKQNFGIDVYPDNYYAPERYYTASGVNVHPRFGIKRLEGARIDGCLPRLLEAMSLLEKDIAEARAKIEAVEVPKLADTLTKCPLLQKLIAG